MKNDNSLPAQAWHESVMTQEVIDFLNLRGSMHIKKQALYIDATVGTGGHAVEIVKNGGKVLGIDLDPKMLEIAQNRLNEACPGFEKDECFKLVHGNFIDIDKIAANAGFTKVDGIVLDLGVSNIHLTGEYRGFSFREPEAPLDMRLDTENQAVKASDLLNVLREDQLFDMFSVTMSYQAAKKLASRVVEIRAEKKFEKVGDFLEALVGARTKKGLHAGTLPMLALRIAVNTELDNLKEVLPKAFELLGKKGRLIVISFHSKEDEIVKDFFESKKDEGDSLTENYVAPSLPEIERNPRSRSARLRAIVKH